MSIVGGDASTLANLEEGSSALTLECKADGNPSPYVWWTKNGQVIATNGAKLILAPVARNHSGNNLFDNNIMSYIAQNGV